MKTDLLEALKQIHKQPMPHVGICHQLSLACDDASESYWRNKIQSLTYKWPKFSGSMHFPVPHPAEPPCLAYNTTQNMWDRRTKYGQARWSLLEFYISELEKELCDGES